MNAVILLHGFLGCADDWREVTEAARRSSPAGASAWRALDWGGLVGADALRAGGMDAAASAVLARLDVLASETGAPCDVVGYSLGARVALHALVTDARRERGSGGSRSASGVVRRAVLVSGTAGLEGAAERADRARLDDDRASALEREGLDAFLRAWYAQPLFDPLRKCAGFAAVECRRRSADATWSAAALRWLSPGRAPGHWGALPGLARRIRTITGSLDATYIGHARRMAALGVPPAAVIADAGHAVHLEAPDLCAKAILRSLHDDDDDAAEA